MSALDDVALAYIALRDEVEALLFLASNADLQRAALTKLGAFVERVERERLAAIIARDEHMANQLLGLSTIGQAFTAELEMYLMLKEGQSESAWVRLIDAQDMVAAAARASSGFSNLEAKFERLRTMETWFFPPQSFMSAGLIARRQSCSICRDDYEKCNHIAGRPYMGRFCNIVLHDVAADHISYVESPYDRRCRVTAISVPGGMRNKMTGVVTPRDKTAKGNMNAIIATEGGGGTG